MQTATAELTIDHLRALNADRQARRARLGFGSRRPAKIEIKASEHEDTAIEVSACRNDVIFISTDAAELGAHVFVGPKDARLKIATIQRAVCTHYNISMIDILSARRTADVVRPRQVAMYLAKTNALRTMPEIGRCFGGRDHTTVLHAVRKITALVETDPEVKATVDDIRAALGCEVEVSA